MSVNEILHFIAQVFFVTLSIAALIDFLRQPNARRRDFALLTSALGIPLGITLIDDLFGFQLGLLDLLGAFALFSQPYFLFRLLQYYRPSRAWLHWAVLGGMVGCWVVLFRYIGANPVTTQVVIFGYGVIVDAYCAWEYRRGARNSVGTLRRRLHFIALGSALFALALGGNALKALFPSLSQPVSAVGLAITAISALLYYIAFIPPRWMIHAWQFDDLRDFLAKSNFTQSNGGRTVENFLHLSSAASQAVNGTMGAVLQRSTADTAWQIVATTDATMTNSALTHGEAVLNDAWQQRQPLTLYVPKIQDKDKRRALQAVAARTWFVVPVMSAARLWGLLLVMMRDRSLFSEDDLSLLQLLAQQTAMLQENNRLIGELEGYSEQLEKTVAARTQELRESQAALLELNATLEQRVEQRTAELRHSNEELDRFAYVASHDLKAPLRAISLLTEWIEQDAGEVLPPESRDHLTKMKHRVQRMETLLNDLLAYSRVNRQHHPIEQVKLTKLVHDITDIVAPPPGFIVEIRNDLVMEIERVPIETIFRNLIGNAIKHHHRPNDGCVKIHAEQQDGFINFAVTDNGPGIAPEFHERIFEIFTTLLPRDQMEGSGIGLAIVKKSVESRGGTIWIESDLGKGTSFNFTWPQNGHG